MRLTSAGLLIALLLAPGQVAAHGGLPGGGGFYSGLAHPIVAVEQLLGLLGFGLLAGQMSGAYARLPLLVLAVGLGAGMAMGVVYDNAEPLMLGIALVFGGFLSAALKIPIWGMAISAGLTGWMIGIDTDVPAPTAADLVGTYAPFAGVFVGVFLIALNAAALSSVALRPVPRIAVRIGGSWIAAIALMVLTLRLRAVVVV